MIRRKIQMPFFFSEKFNKLNIYKMTYMYSGSIENYIISKIVLKKKYVSKLNLDFKSNNFAKLQ